MNVSTGQQLYLGVMVVVLIGFVCFPLSVAAQESTLNNETANESQWILWTNETQIATGVETAALSHADTDGTMHIGYISDETVSYANATLFGNVRAQTEIASVSGDDITLEATAPGSQVAHVVWQGQDPVTDAQHIKHAVVRDNEVVATQTVVSTADPHVSVSLEDVEADQYGRTHVLIKRVRDSESGIEHDAGSLEDHIISENGTLKQSTTVYSTNPERVRYRSMSGNLVTRDDELLAVYAYNDYQSASVVGPRGQRDETSRLRVKTYDNEPNGITEASDRQIAGAKNQEPSARVDWATSHPDGYLLVRGTAPNFNGRVALYSRSDGILTAQFLTERVRHPLWDVNDTLYAWSENSYIVVDREGSKLRESAQYPGFQDWALNGEGYVSMLRLDGNALQYRAQVTATATEYPEVYERVGGGTEAQDAVIAELEAEIQTLEERLNESQSSNSSDDETDVELTDDGGDDDGSDDTAPAGNGDTEEEGDTADGDGPGFGISGALTAIGGAAYILHRRLDRVGGQSD